MIDVWNTLESAFDVIIGNLRTAEKDLPEHKIQTINGGLSLMDFLLFENQAINGAIVCQNLQRRAYNSPDKLDQNYRNLAKQGYATEQDGLFSVTDKGRALYLDYFAQKANAYAKVTLLSEDDFTDFINFLEKGYEAGKVAEKPAHKPSMVIGNDFYTTIGGGQLGTLLGWINLFELYRDDVHASAWQNAGLTGIQIEALTQIWRDVANTIEALSDDLAFRGYTPEEYQEAIDALASKGLLDVNNGHYTLTEKGVNLREQIEIDTDSLFNTFCAETYSTEELANFERIIGIIKTS
ncbi:MAG: hypothetical protein Phog2KO_41610 [Phototrophicaceae bacterium]